MACQDSGKRRTAAGQKPRGGDPGAKRGGGRKARDLQRQQNRRPRDHPVPRKTPKSCSCSRTCLNRVPSAIQSRKHQEERLQKRFWKHRAEDSLEKKGTSPRFSSPEPPCTGPHPSLASSKAFVPVSTHWLQYSLKRIALEMDPLKKATCRQRSAPSSSFPSLQDISAFPHL